QHHVRSGWQAVRRRDRGRHAVAANDHRRLGADTARPASIIRQRGVVRICLTEINGVRHHSAYKEGQSPFINEMVSDPTFYTRRNAAFAPDGISAIAS